MNPIGGKGKGRSIVKEMVLPILKAAGCVVEVIGEDEASALTTETKHRLHAEEIAHKLPINYEWVLLKLC